MLCGVNTAGDLGLNIRFTTCMILGKFLKTFLFLSLSVKWVYFWDLLHKSVVKSKYNNL